MRAFVLGVADLLRRPGSRRHEVREGPVAGLRVIGSTVPPGATAVVDAVLESVAERIVVNGTVTAPWEGECRRCLRPVGGTLRSQVRELFERDATEGETYELAHDRVDLEPLVREALVLELPLAPLCTEGCLGICPRCGADLNQGACECPPTDPDPRWAALDRLFEDSDRAP